MLLSWLRESSASNFKAPSKQDVIFLCPGESPRQSPSFLKEGHTFAGLETTSDPLLAQLLQCRDPCVLRSLAVCQAIPGTALIETLDLVENEKLVAINIGDVAQYREQSAQDTAMVVVKNNLLLESQANDLEETGS